MSIEIIDHRIFQRITAQLFYYANDSRFGEYITGDLDTTETGLLSLVHTWHGLNLQSCRVQHYGGEIVRDVFVKAVPGFTPLSEIAFLKHLTYVEGFIHPELIEKEDCMSDEQYNALDALRLLIRRVMEVIVARLPEYAETPWPDGRPGEMPQPFN